MIGAAPRTREPAGIVAEPPRAARAPRHRGSPGALGRRSGAVLEALADALAAPAPPFPLPPETTMRHDAGRWLRVAPAGQRLLVRWALVALDVLARRGHPRIGFAKLPRASRLELLQRWGRRFPALDAGLDALGRIAVLAYWSDPRVLATLARIEGGGER